MDKLNKLIVSGMGTGYLPIAPGTWGSAAVTALFLLAAWASGGRWHCVSGTMLVIVVSAGVACVALGKFAEKAYGRKDPSQCTIDEWAGQAVTYLLMPPFLCTASFGWAHWLFVAALGFVAFRIADIIKPPPARKLEKLPAGWGVLLDDLASGIYANLTCQVILRLWLLETI